MRLEKYEEAISIFKKILSTKPDYLEAQKALVSANIKQQNIAEASKLLKNLLARFPFD